MEMKDKEVQMLKNQLQLREMELARLKLANLKELKEEKKLADSSLTSATKESYCPKKTVHNPFRREGTDVTRSTQLLSITTPLAQPLMTTHILTPSHEGQTATTKPTEISQVQADQQVTNVSTSLSDTLFVSRPISSIGMVNNGRLTAEGHTCNSRRGKAPPIDAFTAQDIGITFDDWLPTLERAATWNEWTPAESLMQLAGHLRGQALQEWKLLLPEDKVTYQAAVKALKERLDPGNQT